ncbi:MAG: xylanase [Oscillospiraceae bacterium]|jgi:oligosaccharide reducing-end xylanase|nr:xylanase [Oscillospiraceae bacterium]
MRAYPNLFAEIGIPEAEINAKIEAAFQTIFFDPDERFYFESPGGMGFMMDTGNMDARTEGMSYGMMMAVQMDRQDIFDRLWLYAKTYMHQEKGPYAGYFAWSVKPSGEKNSQGPAPDGEEYFAMALLFAAARWGDKEELLDYTAQARDILRHCVHQAEMTPGGQPMWNPDNHQIKFVPETEFSDPSYHLPHFYELFAERADESDRPFWKEAARASRAYLEKACHPVTGMASEYAEYDGSPKQLFGKQQQFYSDAYRVAMNIGLDAAWFGKTPALSAAVDRLQRFFSETTELGLYGAYMLDGTPMGEPAMHPTAIIATNAAGSLAANGPYRLDWVRDFWNQPLRKGIRRYYDNCLYFFSLLMLAGRYRIY